MARALTAQGCAPTRLTVAHSPPYAGIPIFDATNEGMRVAIYPSPLIQALHSDGNQLIWGRTRPLGPFRALPPTCDGVRC
jgi:hypothetical protein